MSSLTEVSLEDFLDLYKEDILAHWDISEWNDFETSSKLTITCMVDFNRRRLGTMSRDMLPAYKKYGKKRREKTRDKYFYDNPFNRIHGFIILEDMTDKKNIPKDKKSVAINVTLQAIDKTFSENDLEEISKKIIDTVSKKTGATIRS